MLVRECRESGSVVKLPPPASAISLSFLALICFLAAGFDV